MKEFVPKLAVIALCLGLGSLVVMHPKGSLSADKEGSKKAEGASADEGATEKHVLLDKDCPEELEFKNKLAAGIREANLAIYPLAAVDVVKKATLLSDGYWSERWNSTMESARKRAKEAGALKLAEDRSNGFDTRSDLGKLCTAVASRDVSMCETPTPQQKALCLLLVGLGSDCAVAGAFQGVCKTIKNPGGGSCLEQGGTKETCQNLINIRKSLDSWCGPGGSMKAIPECLGAMAGQARVQGKSQCAPREGMERLLPLCDAMVSGNVEGCGKGLAGLEADEPTPEKGTELPALRVHLEGTLHSTEPGERSLVIWAAANRKAVCHVKATITNPSGEEVATVEDIVRVLDNRTTDTQIIVPLRNDVDVFADRVAFKSECTSRYWW